MAIQKVKALIEKLIGNRSINVEHLLLDLMKIDSTSGRELKACDYVFSLLGKLGFKTYKIPVNENGYVIISKIGEPKVYFSSHLDTVPPFIPPKETPTHIIGRGSCDAKSSVAAMIVAGQQAQIAKMNNFGFIFTVGEEIDHIGAREVLKHKLKIPFVVAGEPTNLRIADRHYGVFEAKLIAKGIEAYGAVDEGRLNAIDKMIDALNILDKAVNEKVFPEGSLYNIGLISGGELRCVISRHAEAYIDLTVPPGDKTNLLKLVKQLVGHLVKVEPVITIPWVSSKIPAKMAKLKIRRGGVLNYASDLSYFRKGVVLGPGSILLSHNKRERVERTQLHKAVEIYKSIIQSFQ